MRLGFRRGPLLGDSGQWLELFLRLMSCCRKIQTVLGMKPKMYWWKAISCVTRSKLAVIWGLLASSNG